MILLVYAILMIFLSACSVPAGSMLIHLQAGKMLNISAKSRPTSAAVMFYQITRASALDHCSLFSLQHNAQCLSGALVAKQQIIIFPRQHKDVLLKLNKASTFLAAVVLFQDSHSAKWYKLIKLSPLMQWLPVVASLRASANSFKFSITRWVV